MAPLLATGRPRYFYPRSPCGERRVHYDNYNLHCVISIHALLAESDARRASRQQPAGISIHALLAESDNLQPGYLALIHSFLSTLSLRRATLMVVLLCHHISISIHALLAESDGQKAITNISTPISIHALLAESDCLQALSCHQRSVFLSTLSLRRAT